MPRKFPRPIRRVAIKLGSGIMANYVMSPQKSGLKALTDQIDRLHRKGIEVVLVSSGAIVLGMGEACLRCRPSDLASLQALAAVGQNVLMRTYSELFKKADIRCAQVLLTWEDFANRARYNNARQTILKILDLGFIPIINENDTIATEEIKFGDNDRLSALVASLIQADLLIILSDVEGFYEIKDGQKNIFREIREVTKEIEGLAQGTSKKHVSRGGMITKLEAVKIATHAQVPCVIAHGETEDILEKIIAGENVGTLFVEKEERLLSQRHWIAFGAKPKGKIVVDGGARDALLRGGKSLLLPGVVSWEGVFKKADVVVVVDQEGRQIARGIVNYSVADLQRVQDKKQKAELIHRDHMVTNEE